MTAAAPLKSVLVAEDDSDLRDLLVMILESRWKVVAVADGLAAVEAIRGGDFAAVVLDVAMPVLDGLSAAALVRETYPRLPIVLHTALDEHHVRSRFTAYSAFCLKPVDLGALLSIIERLIATFDDTGRRLSP